MISVGVVVRFASGVVLAVALVALLCAALGL